MALYCKRYYCFISNGIQVCFFFSLSLSLSLSLREKKRNTLTFFFRLLDNISIDFRHLRLIFQKNIQLQEEIEIFESVIESLTGIKFENTTDLKSLQYFIEKNAPKVTLKLGDRRTLLKYLKNMYHIDRQFFNAYNYCREKLNLPKKIIAEEDMTLTLYLAMLPTYFV